jgi:hypothetical protein
MPFLYVDATSGGMILQVLLSGFVGGLVFLKLFWGNLVNTVLRRKPEEAEAPATADSHDEASPTVSG